MVYQELLKLGEMIKAVCYKQPLMKLNEALKKSDQSMPIVMTK